MDCVGVNADGLWGGFKGETVGYWLGAVKGEDGDECFDCG